MKTNNNNLTLTNINKSCEEFLKKGNKIKVIAAGHRVIPSYQWYKDEYPKNHRKNKWKLNTELVLPKKESQQN